jgi:outer membrane protein assembly factor BamB
MIRTDNCRGRFILKCRLAGTVALFCGLAATTVGAGDWTRFRGPGGQGKAEATGLPSTWDSNENVVWKANLPGPGTSSPIILGNKVFVTCYSGYGETIDDPGEVENLMRHLVCIDRTSGKIMWDKTFKAKMPESLYSGGRNNTWHGYASSTPVTDGERLYVFFGISGVYAFDLDGNVLWQTDVGSETHGWGCATSPVLHGDLLIVNASVESKAMVALDKATGKEVWKVDGVSKCWSSPMLVEVGGKQELVLNLPDAGKGKTSKLKGFDPASGKELWSCAGPPDSYLCASAVSHDGIVYVIGARKNTAIAVRAGGRGDVTNSHVLWTVKEGSNVTSPVYIDGYLYFMHEKGSALCLDAKTGEVVYKEKLEPSSGLIYSSVLAADGKLYAPSQHNGTYVLAAKPKFELLAVNTFQDDEARANASVAVSNNQLIMRTDKALYCIGE